jgi:hypothetical protein
MFLFQRRGSDKKKAHQPVKTVAGRRLMALKEAPKSGNPLKHCSFLIGSPLIYQYRKGGEALMQGTVEVTDLFKGTAFAMHEF